MAGKKTHEQQVRTFERKDDHPDGGRAGGATQRLMETGTRGGARDREARRSEFPVSRQGMNQESTHNKHNDGGQPGHRPQKHDEAEEGN